MDAASMMMIRIVLASVLVFWIAVTFCAATYDPATVKKWPLSKRLIQYLLVVLGWG